MGKQRKRTRIDFRVSQQELGQIDFFCELSNRSRSQFLREAVIAYMKHECLPAAQSKLPGWSSKSDNEEQRKATNRICSMLAKLSIDTHTLLRFMWECADEDGRILLERCREKSTKRLLNKGTDDEAAIASNLSGQSP